MDRATPRSVAAPAAAEKTRLRSRRRAFLARGVGAGAAALLPLRLDDVLIMPSRGVRTRFAAAVPPANPSLGRAEVALLRAVNAGLAGRLDRSAYLRVVKKEYAEGELAARGSGGSRGSADRPRAPHRLHGLLDGLALHTAMRPDRISPQRIRSVLARHLDSLDLEEDGG